MPKNNHTHKFKRLRYKSGNEVFFCTLPDCNVKMNPALCLGKRCICWRCSEEFILNEYALRLAKPHCENCHKPKKIEEPIEVSEEITEIHAEGRDLQNPIHTLAERLQQTINAAQQNSVNSEKEEDI